LPRQLGWRVGFAAAVGSIGLAVSRLVGGNIGVVGSTKPSPFVAFIRDAAIELVLRFAPILTKHKPDFVKDEWTRRAIRTPPVQRLYPMI
jgi:hypothetical protein